MSQLARDTGISRQGLYLHFPSRSALLIALVEHVDRTEGLLTETATVDRAGDGPAQVRAWAAMQVRRNPRIALFARALDAARANDPASAAAWQDRADNRMRGATAISNRLRHEGRVHPDWTAREAAVLLWELTSFRVWDDLVNQAGLPPERYIDIVTITALAALMTPVARGTAAAPRAVP